MREQWHVIINNEALMALSRQQVHRFDRATLRVRLKMLVQRLSMAKGKPEGCVEVSDPKVIRRLWRHDRLACEYVVTTKTVRKARNLWRRESIHTIEIVSVILVPR